MKFVSLFLAVFLLAFPQISYAEDVDLPLTKSEQKAFNPEQVLEELLAGNQRFAAGQPTQRDIPGRITAASSGQFPKAVILSCLDSRVPVEKVFDVSIGDIFVGRVAGNIVNEDQLGSMEFATKLAGAKLVMILGHSECGAVKGAIDGAELGNLTALLAKIQPAAEAVEGFSDAERTSSNAKFLDKVITQNVHEMVATVRKNSPVLAKMEQAGEIKIVGATYDLHTGKVTLTK
ncbi:MAG: carbonic anhydrase [Candidatus Electrothrix sp. MAN1_4]|nr:carbonic anhydrase [Candidatus Electrothrix sp. MAN1_4]